MACGARPNANPTPLPDATSVSVRDTACSNAGAMVNAGSGIRPTTGCGTRLPHEFDWTSIQPASAAHITLAGDKPSTMTIRADGASE